jgi:hypothetical protein
MFRESKNMSNPGPAPLHDGFGDERLPSYLPNMGVGNVVTPRNSKNLPQALGFKGENTLQLCLRQGPGLTGI